jgi:hypothetical protein
MAYYNTTFERPSATIGLLFLWAFLKTFVEWNIAEQYAFVLIASKRKRAS